MKQRTVNMCIYEPGDILDISKCRGVQDKNEVLLVRTWHIDCAKRYMVTCVKRLYGNNYQLWGITNYGKEVELNPEEHVDAVYLDHIDLTALGITPQRDEETGE